MFTKPKKLRKQIPSFSGKGRNCSHLNSPNASISAWRMMPSSMKKVGRINQACCVRIFWRCDTNRTPDRDPVIDPSINYYQVYQSSTWQTNEFFGVAHRSRDDSKSHLTKDLWHESRVEIYKSWVWGQARGRVILHWLVTLHSYFFCCCLLLIPNQDS